METPASLPLSILYRTVIYIGSYRILYKQKCLMFLYYLGFKIPFEELDAILDLPYPVFVAHLNDIIKYVKFIDFINIEPYNQLRLSPMRRFHRCETCHDGHYDDSGFSVCEWNMNMKSMWKQIIDMAMVLRSAIKQNKITINSAVDCLKMVYPSLINMQVEGEIILYHCSDIYSILMDILVFRSMAYDKNYLDMLDTIVSDKQQIIQEMSYEEQMQLMI